MSTTTSRVVIIGGGFAGCKVAQLLLAEPNFQVTLIDPSNFFEVTWVNLRALVAPEWAQRSIIPYTTILRGNFKHIQGEVASIEAKKVLTKSGQEVEFDFCVIAVGSSYAGFLKAAATTTAAAQRLSEIHALNQQIKGASSVLVVGGGPSGVELAAEILEAHPSKKLTLVHSTDRLLPALTVAASAYALRRLRERGAVVHLSSRATQSGSGWKLSNGSTVAADVVFQTTGSKVEPSIAPNCVDPAGLIKVLPTFQVQGLSPQIFACGDVCNTQEFKTGYLAQQHAVVVAHNIKTLAQGSGRSLKTYAPGPAIMMVTLGAGDGVAQLPCCTSTGFLPKKMKSGHLFLQQIRDDFGVPRDSVVPKTW